VHRLSPFAPRNGVDDLRSLEVAKRGFTRDSAAYNLLKVRTAVAQLEVGNFGDHKSVGGEVWERRINFEKGNAVKDFGYVRYIAFSRCKILKDVRERGFTMSYLRRSLLWMFLVSMTTHAGTGRTWTDHTGKHQVEAELVEVKGGKVRLSFLLKQLRLKFAW